MVLDHTHWNIVAGNVGLTIWLRDYGSNKIDLFTYIDRPTIAAFHGQAFWFGDSGLKGKFGGYSNFKARTRNSTSPDLTIAISYANDTSRFKNISYGVEFTENDSFFTYSDRGLKTGSERFSIK